MSCGLEGREASYSSYQCSGYQFRSQGDGVMLMEERKMWLKLMFSECSKHRNSVNGMFVCMHRNPEKLHYHYD